MQGLRAGAGAGLGAGAVARGPHAALQLVVHDEGCVRRKKSQVN